MINNIPKAYHAMFVSNVVDVAATALCYERT